MKVLIGVITATVLFIVYASLKVSSSSDNVAKIIFERKFGKG